MHIKADTLDDLLREVLGRLLQAEEKVDATRGTFTELFGVVLQLSNPRARLSRSEMKGKVFSALGEWLWYLSGANALAFIDYYLPGIYKDESDDGGETVRSGYGERLYCHRGLIRLRRSSNCSRRSRQRGGQLFSCSTPLTLSATMHPSHARAPFSSSCDTTR